MERTADRLIDRLAQPGLGLVELNRAEAAGVTRQNMRSRSGRGALRRLHAGVYVTMGSTPTWEQRVHAACLAAGPQALASHRTAAVIWGLIEPPAPIDVVVPYARCPAPAGVNLHRSTDLREVDAAVRRSVPVTNPMRTVGDLGAVAPKLVPSAIEKGLFLNRFTLAGLWRVVDDLGRRGRRGIGVLRRTLEERALGDERTRSPLEPLLAAIAADAGIQLEYQYPVRVDGRRYVLDFAVPELLVAVEVDGLETHATRRALEHDDERQNRLVLAGWQFLRYTRTRLVRRRAAVREELLDLIEMRRGSRGP